MSQSGRERKQTFPDLCPQCDSSDTEIRPNLCQGLLRFIADLERVITLLASGGPAMRPSWAGCVRTTMTQPHRQEPDRVSSPVTKILRFGNWKGPGIWHSS